MILSLLFIPGRGEKSLESISGWKIENGRKGLQLTFSISCRFIDF
jgi:hypothetical protein